MIAHTSTIEHLRFPNESGDYRVACNELLEEEMALRRQVERVAAQRRALPPGGVAKDYAFEGPAGAVKLSDLFETGKDTLAIYSFMFGPERERPCPGCTHFLDALDGQVPHIEQRLSFVVVAKSPIGKLRAFAQERGWNNLRLLSTAANQYDRDYYGDASALSDALRKQQEFEAGDDGDMPILNVFRRDGSEIRHFWASELLYVPAEPGQEYRHNDALDPLWNMLDLTPQGRADFHPQLHYS